MVHHNILVPYSLYCVSKELKITVLNPLFSNIENCAPLH